MNDHLDPNDPARTDADADARIDALARAAGSQLRRPAPADGIGRAQRTSQRRQVTRVALSGTAVLAVMAIGVVALTGGDDRAAVVPATLDTTVDTTVDSTDTPETTSTFDTTVPSSSAPADTAVTTVPSSADGAPVELYTSDRPFSYDGNQSVLDPLTGAVLRSQPIDQSVSRAALDAVAVARSLPCRSFGDSSGGDDFGFLTHECAVGSITYAIDRMYSEMPSYDMLSAETRDRFDRCAQSSLRVTGVGASALPERASTMAIGPDGRWLITLGGECSEAGTLDDGPRVDVIPSFQLFDAARPELPGRVLSTASRPLDVLEVSLSFSADGRFAAAGTIYDLRFFDLVTATEIEIVPDGCTATGTKWSFILGPWIGESSVALQLSCGAASRLLVTDLVSGESLDVAARGVAQPYSILADVDVARYDRPETAWFTLCELSADPVTGTASTCWLGRGDGPLIDLPGVGEASFLPLGQSQGG